MDPEEIRQKIQEEKTYEQKPEKKFPVNPQIVFSWKAPARAYKVKSQGVMRFYFALGLLLCLIAFFLGEKILVLPIGAVLFLVYVLTITPPPIIENKITKFGIETSGNTYRWEYLSHFYFSRRFDYEQIVVVSHAPYSQHIYLVIKEPHEKEQVLKLLSEHIIYIEEPHKSFADRLTDLLMKLMPSEDYVVAEPKVQQSAPSEPVVQSL
jgi:hypothetical protein